MGRAYRWDLWGAAYIIQGGCSDDAFEYFRSTLISLGRDTFERAVADPDSLVELEAASTVDLYHEGFQYIASQVYRGKTGSDEAPPSNIRHPREPAGRQWEEEWDDLKKLCPRLWAKYGSP
jgi:hypothetical protein